MKILFDLISRLSLLAGLLALVAPLRADNPPTYLFQIDSNAVPGGFSPVEVALDSGNNVYVSDDSNSRIVKFSADGTYLTQWGGSGGGNGQFNNPAGIAVDSSNNVYVADLGNDRIEKFTSGGNYLTQWSGNGEFFYFAGLAVDSSNNVYVAATYYSLVEKFDSSGNYLTQWSGNGQFGYDFGIAVDSSNIVYVADYSYGHVAQYTSSGNYLTEWGSSGSGNGQFDGPIGLAVDSSNNVYVTDAFNQRVEKFTSSGNYLTQWGSHGSGNGQFDGPDGIAVDRSGNVIYVVDGGSSRIEVFVNNTNIVPPYITLQPANQTAAAGVNVTFSVGVVGTAPFAYQWSSNNVAVPGATDATFTLTNVSLSASATYAVLVTNNFGGGLSRNAALAVLPPLVTTQPASLVVLGGTDVTFDVGLFGTPPIAYQWIFNNIAVASATNTTFTLTNVNLSASGNYSVMVTNSYGGVLSSNAVLTVLPALVATQPASGVSAIGALLNGSANVGVESLAWFEWGTDTNYGNITGATVVPGSNGSNIISAPLNGLPGNFYHYRIDAANDFGIVYGEDQSFTVGFAPGATTLPSTNGENGATLEAAVNPHGWDTTVYFRWGTPTLTHTTPSMDIGAGATSLNVSSLVSGLVASTRYQFQVVASNALGTTFGQVFYWDQLAQANINLFSGAETNITLPPGTYIITAYGAPGGGGDFGGGGGGAEMSAEFNFSTSTTLTLLVGGGAGPVISYWLGGGGGGGSFVVEGSTPLIIAGGGGGGSLYGSGGYGAVGPNGVAGGFSGDAGGDGPGGTGGGGGSGGSGDGSGGGGGGFLGDGTYGIGFGTLQGGGSGGGYGGGSFESGFGGGGGGGSLYGSGNGPTGGGGGGGGYSGGGGAGNQHDNSEFVGGGGGGGSIIDSSAIAILAEASGRRIASPDDPANGEIIITAVLPPALAINTGGAFGFTNGVFGFTVIGPSGSNVVIQASTDLQTWIPLQTNLLGTGPLYFSDARSTTNTQRFYRVQLSP